MHRCEDVRRRTLVFAEYAAGSAARRVVKAEFAGKLLLLTAEIERTKALDANEKKVGMRDGDHLGARVGSGSGHHSQAEACGPKTSPLRQL